MTKNNPILISKNDHCITHDQISPYALKVLQGLHEAGYDAYLVGGSVRDLLLGFTPKDFDIATNAHPEQIRRVFPNCRLIGRRFRLAHVYFRKAIIEVATFRGLNENQTNTHDHLLNDSGMIIRDNIYGSMKDDAWRRDFTINALYYNYENGAVVDYTGGIDHLKNRIISVIGEATKRYHEDPVRMLRAIRLAAKLECQLAPETKKPIHQLAGLLQNVPDPRLFEEMMKLYKSGKSTNAFLLLREHGIFSVLFPQTEICLVNPHHDFEVFLRNALNSADQRVAEQKSLNPAFLFATVLWPPVKVLIDEYINQQKNSFTALHLATDKVLKQQNKALRIPKRLLPTLKEIWVLQQRLSLWYRYHKHIGSLFYNPRFRAAYDFLLLRAKIEKDLEESCAWWTQFQKVDNDQREKMLGDLKNHPKHAL